MDLTSASTFAVSATYRVPNRFLWTVQEITLAKHEHDSLVGEAFNVHNTDLCQVADSQETLDINNQWAQVFARHL